MKTKVKNAVDLITGVIQSWNGVHAIVLQHFAEKEVYDPNFSVTLDVFRSGSIPTHEERSSAFVGAQYFESSRTNSKDRFMLGELPVRISYKDTNRVDAVIGALGTDSWLSMERGTYLFHRIVTGTLVWSRGDWITGVMAKLDDLPDSFWITWNESCHRRIDHFLGDMGAAVFKDDPLYFQLSLSGFLKAVVESLCAVNRVFEPGPRDYTSSLALFEVLPEGFWANWQSLLREDGELPGERKREIADLLARGIFALIP